jgi:hypothetical protein
MPILEQDPPYVFVTPYYKETRTCLERCIASVKQQTMRADHILVADGFPQDATNTAITSDGQGGTLIDGVDFFGVLIAGERPRLPVTIPITRHTRSKPPQPPLNSHSNADLFSASLRHKPYRGDNASITDNQHLSTLVLDCMHPHIDVSCRDTDRCHQPQPNRNQSSR